MRSAPTSDGLSTRNRTPVLMPGPMTQRRSIRGNRLSQHGEGLRLSGGTTEPSTSASTSSSERSSRPSSAFDHHGELVLGLIAPGRGAPRREEAWRRRRRRGRYWYCRRTAASSVDSLVVRFPSLRCACPASPSRLLSRLADVRRQRTCRSGARTPRALSRATPRRRGYSGAVMR